MRIRSRSALTTLVAILVTLVGTGLEAQQPPPTPPTAQPRQEQQARRRRGDRTRLTRQDLDEGGTAIVTARDAIRILRPHWLQPPVGRQASSNLLGDGGGARVVMIYLDGTRQMDHEVLNTVRNAEIVEMRYLDQNRAIGVHGPGHEAGVIEITTKAKKP